MIVAWPRRLRRRASRTIRRRVLFASVVALLSVACSQPPFTFSATGPLAYTANVDPTFGRVAIQVTIANQSGDDLSVNPGDFVARDAEHHVYPANPTAATADVTAVRLASAVQRSQQSISSLPTVTLRQGDILTGFVVFDVPAGVRLVELIWRQSDTDYPVQLPAG